MLSKLKITDKANSLLYTKLDGNKVLRNRPRAATFVLISVNF